MVNDPEGYQLADGFILDDSGVGYDIYCTNWEMLEADAECNQAHLSKLLDAPLVYERDSAAVQRLEALKQRARGLLASDTRFEKADAAFDAAKGAYADCMLAEDLAQVRLNAGTAVHHLLDAVMLYHGGYFKKGVKRTFEELAALELPFDMETLIMAVICGATAGEIRAELTRLMNAVKQHLQRPKEKVAPCQENLRGTYEEMYSNWGNKMREAAQREDMFSSFMNLLSLQYMLRELSDAVAIPEMDVLGAFDPRDAKANAMLFETALGRYREKYRKAGLRVRRFAGIDEYLAEYLKPES